MAATTNVMSWEDFERLPDGDGYHRELIEGELQVLPPPKSGHSKVARRMNRALEQIESAAEGQVFVEAGYKIAASPASWIQPDVSFLRNERLQSTADGEYFLGAPDLSVEVVSRSESAADLNHKVELTLRAGALAVWVVYPRRNEVLVHRPDGSAQRYGLGDVLSLPELLPGFELPVARIFAD